MTQLSHATDGSVMPARPRAAQLGLAIVWAAIVGFLILGGFEAWHDSATFDEPVYVSSGVIGVLHHDLTVNAEHPPLFKVLAALPVLAVGPVVPGDGKWNVNNERVYSARFVQAQMRAGTMHRVTVAARVVPLLEAALVALVLYALASLLFGTWSGVVAALLWLLDPLVLGLGHLDGVDLPFALTTALVSLTLIRWLRRRDRRSLLWLGAACGAAVSAQSTGLLLAAIAAAVVLVGARRAGGRGRAAWGQPALVALVSWVVVWIVYLVLDPSVVVHSWVVLPQPYVEGLRYLFSHDTSSAPGFLFGVSWTGANVWFWPATLLVKLSTPVLLVLVAGSLGFVALVRMGRVSASTWRHVLVGVIVPGAVLMAVELPNPRTLGVRYLLPVIALWIVVASPIALVAGRRLVAVTLGLVLVAAAVVVATSYPHSIAYTAAPFRPGYRVATDSNVDWGQDFSLLTAWSRGRHPYVAYFGPRGITASSIPGARPLVGTAPSAVSGWVAASASDLTSADRSSLAWLRGYCPVGTLGGSILLYYFATAPDAGAGPSTPAAVCSGSLSHRTSSAAAPSEGGRA
ncbi:MAG TPA: glycosyltransferase family 39 protein [Acidimicrobiales bacterium]|jgi:4-amino-4-deoxy-L-arabinose transferase-like glycosyltransferase